jgi:hypothetical protein
MSSLPNAFAELEDEKEEVSFVATDASFDTPVEPAQIKVKAPVPNPNEKPQYKTAAQFVKDAIATDEALKTAMQAQNFSGGTQVLPRGKTPVKKDAVIDFTKMSESDIYNDSIPLEAKPFGDDDSLLIDLKDKNYAARWVNKNSIMLSKALRSGFQFITQEDLASPLQVEITEDVNGRYLNGDVYAMRILKSIYFAALKATHQRAVNTVSALSSQKAAKKHAYDAMIKETGGGFAEEYEAGKVGFYTPGIEI